MFKVILNNTVMSEYRIYGQALNKAKKIRELYFQPIYEVLVENPNGLIMDRL